MKRGVTLLELLVAMTLAGIVAVLVGGWIEHSATLSAKSQARDDRAQELSLLRSAAFQDGTRGHAILVSHDGWSIELRRPDGGLDTVVWRISDGFVERGEHRWLPSDTVVGSTLVPLRAGADPALDPWPELDRNLDGEVDDDRLRLVDALRWTLVVRHRGFLSDSPVSDSVRITIPLHGPG